MNDFLFVQCESIPAIEMLQGNDKFKSYKYLIFLFPTLDTSVYTGLAHHVDASVNR